jgi:protein TonB
VAEPIEPYRIGAGVSAPVAEYTVEPVYPDEARAAKYQGEVLITTVIDDQGIPTEITVVRGLGLGLDEAATEAVSQWRFKPGMKNGVPVPVRATLSVQFRFL